MKKSNPFCLLETMHAVVVEVVRKNTPYEKDVWVYRRTPRARKGKVRESIREWSRWRGKKRRSLCQFRPGTERLAERGKEGGGSIWKPNNFRRCLCYIFVELHIITNHQATSGRELKTSRAVAQNPPGAHDEHQGVLKPTSELFWTRLYNAA